MATEMIDRKGKVVAVRMWGGAEKGMVVQFMFRPDQWTMMRNQKVSQNGSDSGVQTVRDWFDGMASKVGRVEFCPEREQRTFAQVEVVR